MYPTSTYVVRRAPSQGCRVARHVPQLSRQLSGGPGYFPPAPFWGALAGRQHPLFGGRRGRDVFDHFDDFVNRSFDDVFSTAPWSGRRTRGAPEQLTWQPRFDVSEVDNAYRLRGELPGVEASDLEVQFTDANTLVISGKTETSRTEGKALEQDVDTNMTSTENAATTRDAAQATEKDDDAASVHSSSSSYVQPTVEDETDVNARENGAESSSTTAGAQTPNTADSVAANGQEQSSKQAEAEQTQPHYWVSERSLGSFQRTFTFTNRVDSEGVTASLKNGILDIVVPKAKAPEAKKITIQ